MREVLIKTKHGRRNRQRKTQREGKAGKRGGGGGLGEEKYIIIVVKITG